MITEAIISINFPINHSVQVGDVLYFTCTNPQQTNSSNFIALSQEPFKLGYITQVSQGSDGEGVIGFNYTSVGNTANELPTCARVFLSFKKDCSVNTSGLRGYFASATLVNMDYQNKNELFAVNSEVTMSSK